MDEASKGQLDMEELLKKAKEGQGLKMNDLREKAGGLD